MLSGTFCSTAELKEHMQIVNKHHSYRSFYGTGSSSYLRLPWMWYGTSCKLFIYPEIPRIQQYIRHNREQLYCIHRFRIHSTMLKRSKNSWDPRCSWRKASTLVFWDVTPCTLVKSSVPHVEEAGNSKMFILLLNYREWNDIPQDCSLEG